MNGLALAASLLLAACTASREPPPAAALPARDRVAVRIEFEPPLEAPVELNYAHECGASGAVTTACTFAELSLPPGPATLWLRVGGQRQERVLIVAPGMPPFVWRRAD